MTTPRELLIAWRTDAERLERRHADSIARLLRDCADELETALRSSADDQLDLTSAARESGYSVDRLRHLIADGQLPNAGRKGSPRVRRGDLPSKGTRAPARRAS